MKNSPSNWRTLLNRWISGEANHGDERSLEVMAQDDPFLMDALEGYRSLPEEDHARSVTKLKAGLWKRYKKEKRDGQFYLVRIAASGVVLLAAWFVFGLLGPNAEKSALSFDERPDTSLREKNSGNAMTENEASPSEVEEPSFTNGGSVEEDLTAAAVSDEAKQSRSDKSTGNKTAKPAAPPETKANRDFDSNKKSVEKEAKKLEQVAAGQKARKLNDAVKEQEAKPVMDGLAIEEGAKKKIDADKGFEKKESLSPAEDIALSGSEPVAPAPPPAAKDVDVAMNQAEKADVYVPPVVQTIKGQVTDYNGEPLIGASVILNNSTYGTVTDVQGYFSIDSPVEDPTLTVTYTGFQQQEIQSEGGMFLNVQLSEGVVLDEIAVTSLSSKRKQKTTPVFEPKGGFKKFEKYIAENLRMPQAAIDANVKGEVTVAFRIGKNGYPTDIEVFRSLGYGCDEEAIRLLEEGPKWKGQSDTLYNYTFPFK